MTRDITIIIDSLAQGGAENVCVTLSNQLVARGWKIDLCPLHLNNSPLKDQLDSRVVVRPFNVPNMRTGWWKVLRYLRQNKVKTLLVFNFQTAVVLNVLRLLRLHATRLIVRNISTLSVKRRQATSKWARFIVHPLTEWFYRHAHFFIAQSEGMKQDLVLNYGIAPDRIQVIYNPLKASIVSASQSRDYLAYPKKPYLLCVGRLMPVKAFDHAIKAFARVMEQHPDLRLRIVGEGPERDNLYQTAMAHQCQDRVDFMPFTQDLVPLYSAALATMLTSQYEGFPNVLSESVALGTPVIAYDCQSGPSEIIMPDNGLLVRYQDQEALAHALQDSLARSWNREAVAATAIRYMPDRIIADYESCLKQMG